MRSRITQTNCTCWMSFVVRVISEADDGPEHVAAQVTANGGGDAGRDKADGDGHGNHEQR